MADHETSVLESQFAALRADLLDQVTPAGPDAVRGTVRHRRRVSRAVGTALALVLVAAPVAGYAALNRDPAPPPAIQPTRPAPAPPATPSAEPTAPPSSATPSDGRISRADLLATRLNLPPWQREAPNYCATRNVKLVSEAPVGGPPELQAVTYGDIDADGAVETIATLGCVIGEIARQQVVVLDRDPQGQIIILGQVTRTEPHMAWIIAVEFAAPDGLRVQVGDIQPCCETPLALVQKQWRTYAWDGKKFHQSGGPTAFGSNPNFADLRVRATDVVFAGQPGDVRHGSTTITIHNAGPREVEQVSLWFDFTAGRKVQPEGDGWDASCTSWTGAWADGSGTGPTCLLGPLPAGQTRTLVLGLQDPAVTPPAGVADVWVAHSDKAGFTWPDRQQKDNTARFHYS